MKVIGESFFYKEKEPKRQDTKVSKLSGKRTVIGQNSGELFIKGWILKLWA